MIFIAPVSGLAQTKPEPGLAVTFTVGGQNDFTTAPNIWLHVQEGKPPTPFLPGGQFTAVWEGFVSVDLRSDFLFQAELNGALKLELNGAVALEVTGMGNVTPLTKPIKLNKGANALKATFTSPAKGDAFVRLNWAERPFWIQPIAANALSHTPTPETAVAAKRNLGRELFTEFRCAKCHAATLNGMPELAMDAPAFESIGSRRNQSWLARWILDPTFLRNAGVHMPRLLHGANAPDDANAIAAYLASLKSASASGADPDAALAGPGGKLFETLHCAGCHNAPGAAEDITKISFTHVREKFAAGALTDFLKKPAAHYVWIRMPDFRLKADEAAQLAAYLFADAKAADATAPADPAVIARGQKLVQTTGCLNCHTHKLENQYTAPKLDDLKAGAWSQGCLAATPPADAKAPRFHFTAPEQEALREFAKTDRASLTRHVPAEFAERQTRLLNCRGCHGQVEGFPPLEILGGKLKPEWMKAFLVGEIAYKPRAETHPMGEPWLPMRMPAFATRAELLAASLAAQHGYAPQTQTEPPIDPEAAKLGQKLTGVDGGFSCVACHGVGTQKATGVFESEGINLAYSAARLQPAYYRRWLRNPPLIDPQTKMPVYFDEEGKSQLTDVLDGSAEKQINAIWQYLRLGDQMPPPATMPAQ